MSASVLSITFHWDKFQKDYNKLGIEEILTGRWSPDNSYVTVSTTGDVQSRIINHSRFSIQPLVHRLNLTDDNSQALFVPAPTGIAILDSDTFDLIGQVVKPSQQALRGQFYLGYFNGNNNVDVAYFSGNDIINFTLADVDVTGSVVTELCSVQVPVDIVDYPLAVSCNEEDSVPSSCVTLADNDTFIQIDISDLGGNQMSCTVDTLQLNTNNCDRRMDIPYDYYQPSYQFNSVGTETLVKYDSDCDGRDGIAKMNIIAGNSPTVSVSISDAYCATLGSTGDSVTNISIAGSPVFYDLTSAIAGSEIYSVCKADLMPSISTLVVAIDQYDSSLVIQSSRDMSDAIDVNDNDYDISSLHPTMPIPAQMDWFNGLTNTDYDSLCVALPPICDLDNATCTSTVDSASGLYPLITCRNTSLTTGFLNSQPNFEQAYETLDLFDDGYNGYNPVLTSSYFNNDSFLDLAWGRDMFMFAFDEPDGGCSAVGGCQGHFGGANTSSNSGFLSENFNTGGCL